MCGLPVHVLLLAGLFLVFFIYVAYFFILAAWQSPSRLPALVYRKPKRSCNYVKKTRFVAYRNATLASHSLGLNPLFLAMRILLFNRNVSWSEISV